MHYKRQLLNKHSKRLLQIQIERVKRPTCHYTEMPHIFSTLFLVNTSEVTTPTYILSCGQHTHIKVTFFDQYMAQVCDWLFAVHTTSHRAYRALLFYPSMLATIQCIMQLGNLDTNSRNSMQNQELSLHLVPIYI